MKEIVNEIEIKQIEALYASDDDPIIIIDDKGNIYGFVSYDFETCGYMIKSGPKKFASERYYHSIQELIKGVKGSEPNYKFYQGVDIHIKL